MRKVSKKVQALQDEYGPIRREFVESNPCMVCGGTASDCHEIARGPSRLIALKNPRLWLSLCRVDHMHMDDYNEWPLAMQVACRIAHELRQTVWDLNAARGRAQTDITVGDVLPHILEMLGDSYEREAEDHGD